eukprot:8558175-Pyramimonas_sp.AAC.1
MLWSIAPVPSCVEKRKIKVYKKPAPSLLLLAMECWMRALRVTFLGSGSHRFLFLLSLSGLWIARASNLLAS